MTDIIDSITASPIGRAVMLMRMYVETFKSVDIGLIDKVHRSINTHCIYMHCTWYLYNCLNHVESAVYISLRDT